MKRFIIKLLHSFTKKVIKKYNPTIIGITGSVGKTATKEAVFSVLKTKLDVRRSIGSFNTEIGLPLTIIGVEKTPKKNPFKWIGIFVKAFGLLVSRQNYPQILVLEMGTDKPGDIQELIKIAPPNIGVITAISAVHTEIFKTVLEIAKEKGKLFTSVSKEGWIMVNNDDKEVVNLANASKAKKFVYGLGTGDDVRVSASEISVSRSNKSATGVSGMSFKLQTNGTVTPIILKHVLGEHQVYPALVAASIGITLGLHMVDVAEGLQKLVPQPGRMRIIDGIKNTIIIDDTYNASPKAMSMAIETAKNLDIDGKTYAVLGDMLELGSKTEHEHRNIGTSVALAKIDILITVGERSRDIARGARDSGMSKEVIFEFDTTDNAGRFVQKRIEQGDLILVKGSRGIGMELIVKEIMASPEKAEELLV